MGKWLRRAVLVLGFGVVALSVLLAWMTQEQGISCPDSIEGAARCVVQYAHRLDRYDWIWFAVAFAGGVVVGAAILAERKARPPFPDEMSEDERWDAFAEGAH